MAFFTRYPSAGLNLGKNLSYPTKCTQKIDLAFTKKESYVHAHYGARGTPNYLNFSRAFAKKSRVLGFLDINPAQRSYTCNPSSCVTVKHGPVRKGNWKA